MGPMGPMGPMGVHGANAAHGAHVSMGPWGPWGPKCRDGSLIARDGVHMYLNTPCIYPKGETQIKHPRCHYKTPVAIFAQDLIG